MKKDSKVKILIFNLIILIFLWSFLEIICTLFYRNLPSKFRNGKRIVEINLGHKVDNTEESIISHPYLLYVNNPFHKDSVLQNNSLGYRGPEFSIKKDSNTIRILVLGGSTTYGYLNKNPEKTWVAVLQKKLQSAYKKKIEVINGGLNYATSAELLASYVFRHRYINPDIIIFHEGGNDAMSVLFPDYNPEYTHFRSNGSSAKLRPGEKFLLTSNVFKLFYSIWLNNTGVIYTSQPFDCGKLVKSDVQIRVTNDSSYVGFNRNVDLLIKLARIDNSKIILMGFLNAPKDIIINTRTDLRNIVDEYIYASEKNNEIMKDLCLLHKIEYIQLNQDLFKDEWFLDNCHLNYEGEELKAEIVFEQIKELL
jgi:lysophospholipase L1-like esterase